MHHATVTFISNCQVNKAKSTDRWLETYLSQSIAAEDWSSESPHFNPLDYKLWTDLEEKVYSKTHRTIYALEADLIKTPISMLLDVVHAVAWVRAEDQTILSLQSMVVTHNSRISVSHDNLRTWQLRIRQLKESDRGCYMCQINTSVMKIQQGCLDVYGNTCAMCYEIAWIFDCDYKGASGRCFAEGLIYSKIRNKPECNLEAPKQPQEQLHNSTARSLGGSDQQRPRSGLDDREHLPRFNRVTYYTNNISSGRLTRPTCRVFEGGGPVNTLSIGPGRATRFARKSSGTAKRCFTSVGNLVRNRNLSNETFNNASKAGGGGRGHSSVGFGGDGAEGEKGAHSMSWERRGY
ncbi:hypothetical protein Trydic_g6181 [Trypoxylus dichotomus]